MSIIGDLEYRRNARNLLFKYCRPPKRASRLRPFGDKGILLRATPPDHFNDPFEFASVIQTDAERLTIEADMQSGLDALDAGIKAILADQGFLSYDDFANRWFRLRENLSKKIGIVCLSACWDDILMWSHYADEHRGFAVVIDRDHPAIKALDFQPVTYSAQRPSLSVESNPQRHGFPIPAAHVRASVYTKSKHWAYEHEWRSVRDLDTASPITLVEMPAAAIPLILLGWRHEKKLANAVSRAVRTWPVAPEIYVMKPHWTDYRLDWTESEPEKVQWPTIPDDDDDKDEEESRRVVSLLAGLDKGRSTYLSDYPAKIL